MNKRTDILRDSNKCSSFTMSITKGENTMNENQMLIEVLAKKEAKLTKRQAWLDEVGMGKLDDIKLAEKRHAVRKEISELIFNIKDIKEILEGK